MMNRRNYQKEMELEIEQTGDGKCLLLHSCCAPCSSSVLERLAQHFEVTVFYYNPNISPESEYRMRVEEQKRLLSQLPTTYPLHFLEGAYEPERFYEWAAPLAEEPEGGKRCFLCYEMRLREAAEAAKEQGFDYFTTTLSVSPLKNADKLNEIGQRLEQEYGVRYLVSDFKKKDGYKRSIELSKEYDLYRQNFCGCIYSLREP
jgi:hypothetical protein